LIYELLSSPKEFNDDGNNQWEHKDGIINVIRNYVGLTNKRARSQIRNVLTFVQDKMAEGLHDIDAGPKLNAHLSGRKQLLNLAENKLVAKVLAQSLGLHLTLCIVNQKRVNAGKAKVNKVTILRAARRKFGGRCHNHQTKKLATRTTAGVFAVCVINLSPTITLTLHLLLLDTSQWAICRLGMGLQLQQQFRVDVAGPSMVGVTVVRLFDGVPFCGKITSYDDKAKWYKVTYADGDVEELAFRQLRVKEWKRIHRDSVLWLDEKV